MRGKPFSFFLVATLVASTFVLSIPASAQVSEKRQEELRAMAKALQPTVEKLRGLKFKRSVPKGIKTPAELRKFMLEELDREVEPEEMAASQRVMERYGLIPKGLDLKKLLVDLYTEQVAGFYNPRTKRLYLIDKSEGGKKDPASNMQEMMLRRVGLSEEKIYMAHELVHALEDQHFRLMSLPMDELENEDRGIGSRSLIEGVATVIMFDLMFGKMGVDPRSIPSEQLFGAGGAPGGTFGKAPEIIRQQMLAPYQRGLTLVRKILDNGGWVAVNRAYHDPPSSSEQVLHPEKYTGERDQPMWVTVPELESTLGKGWKEIETNVFGEMTISIWLKKYVGAEEASVAAAGWDGDRYRAYSKGKGLSIVHYFTWDSEKDAQEFVSAYSKTVSERYPGVRGVQKTDNRIHWSHKTGQILIERQGTEVVMIEGVRRAALDQVLAQAWKSTKTEHTGGLPKNLKPYPWPKKKKSEPAPPSVTKATGFRYEVPGSWREAKIRNDRFPVVLTSKRGDAEIRIATLETDQKAPTFTRKMLVRLPRHLDGFKRISLRRDEVDDRKASIIDYAGQSRDSGGPHRYRQVIYRAGEKLYVLTFVAPETAFSRHIKAFERFLDSVSH